MWCCCSQNIRRAYLTFKYFLPNLYLCAQRPVSRLRQKRRYRNTGKNRSREILMWLLRHLSSIRNSRVGAVLQPTLAFPVVAASSDSCSNRRSSATAAERVLSIYDERETATLWARWLNQLSERALGNEKLCPRRRSPRRHVL